MQVKKRDGTLEDLNVEKLHKVVMYACEGIAGVSASEVEIHSYLGGRLVLFWATATFITSLNFKYLRDLRETE